MQGSETSRDRKAASGANAVGLSALVADPPIVTWFREMIPHCLEYARTAKEQGHPVIGVMCQFTPRELIMAAGGVPVCLCCGSSNTIPASECDLPSNLCPLIKSTYGYHTLKTNPFMEMADLIVAETTCDGMKKMFELLARERPIYVLELPQKSDSIQSMVFWENELRRFKAALQERFGVEITNDLIRKAILVMNRERRLRRQLAEFMMVDDPPLTGRQLLDLRSNISGIACDLRQYAQAIDWLKGRPGGGYASCTRVLLTGVPLAPGAEGIVDIIEGNGGLVVCTENCSGLKPILEDVDEHIQDPIVALASKYYQVPCAVMTRNDRRMDIIRQLCKKYRPECVVDLVWRACLTYDVESTRVRRLVEEEMSLPYLRIETDDSPDDSDRIAQRVRELFRVVQQHKSLC